MAERRRPHLTARQFADRLAFLSAILEDTRMPDHFSHAGYSPSGNTYAARLANLSTNSPELPPDLATMEEALTRYEATAPKRGKKNMTAALIKERALILQQWLSIANVRALIAMVRHFRSMVVAGSANATRSQSTLLQEVLNAHTANNLTDTGNLSYAVACALDEARWETHKAREQVRALAGVVAWVVAWRDVAAADIPRALRERLAALDREEGINVALLDEPNIAIRQAYVEEQALARVRNGSIVRDA